MRFNKKTALITGGGTGIGAAAADGAAMRAALETAVNHIFNTLIK